MDGVARAFGDSRAIAMHRGKQASAAAARCGEAVTGVMASQS
jgi:hypothetical protein